ncbi:MAG: hypothetical protein ACK4S0_13320 [Sediminibacterium sp.]
MRQEEAAGGNQSGNGSVHSDNPQMGAQDQQPIEGGGNTTFDEQKVTQLVDQYNTEHAHAALFDHNSTADDSSSDIDDSSGDISSDDDSYIDILPDDEINNSADYKRLIKTFDHHFKTSERKVKQGNKLLRETFESLLKAAKCLKIIEMLERSGKIPKQTHISSSWRTRLRKIQFLDDELPDLKNRSIKPYFLYDTNYPDLKEFIQRINNQINVNNNRNNTINNKANNNVTNSNIPNNSSNENNSGRNSNNNTINLNISNDNERDWSLNEISGHSPNLDDALLAISLNNNYNINSPSENNIDHNNKVSDISNNRDNESDNEDEELILMQEVHGDITVIQPDPMDFRGEECTNVTKDFWKEFDLNGILQDDNSNHSFRQNWQGKILKNF